MHKVLVVTSDTEIGAHMTQRIYELRETFPDLEVHVLVAASKRVSSIYGYEIDGAERAAYQLRTAIDLMASIGVTATGEIGGHDPMNAVQQVFPRVEPDLILVSTFGSGVITGWLNMDLPHRIQRRLKVPVESIQGQAVNDNDWENSYQPVEGPVRILLVEDEPADAHLMRHALADASERIDLTTVKNGAEAVEFLRTRGQEEVDLVLLDLNTPIVDGHEFLEIAGQEFDVDSLNITVVTSSTATKDRELAHALGAGAYVIKDPDIDVFADAIRSVIREVGYVGPS